MFLNLSQKNNSKNSRSHWLCSLIDTKIADENAKVSRTSPQNSLEIKKERYISPEERQKIIGDLRLIWQYNNAISKK